MRASARITNSFDNSRLKYGLQYSRWIINFEKKKKKRIQGKEGKNSLETTQKKNAFTPHVVLLLLLLFRSFVCHFDCWLLLKGKTKTKNFFNRHISKWIQNIECCVECVCGSSGWITTYFVQQQKKREKKKEKMRRLRILFRTQCLPYVATVPLIRKTYISDIKINLFSDI